MNQFQIMPLLLMKTTLVLAVVWVVYLAIAKLNPRWQVWTIRMGSCGLLIVMVTALAPPMLQLPILALSEEQAAIEASQPAVPTPAKSVQQPLPFEPATRVNVVTPQRPDGGQIAGPISTATERQSSSMPQIQSHESSVVKSLSWPMVLLIVWALGIAFGLIRWVCGSVRLRRIARCAVPVGDSVRASAASIAASLNIPLPRILMSDAIGSRGWQTDRVAVLQAWACIERLGFAIGAGA
jgi:hypothetical protein